MNIMIKTFWIAAFFWLCANVVMFFKNKDKDGLAYRIAETISAMATGAEVGLLMCYLFTI